MRVSRLHTLILSACTAACLPFAAASAASAPTGVWIDHTGRGAVEIKTCDGNKLCGHVVWTKSDSDSKGCGLQILGDVNAIGGGQWDNGWIYSPEKKQKFSVELTPLDGNRLRVKGYKGIKLLSKTMIWHRASSTLKRCDAPAVEAKATEPTVKPKDVGAPTPASKSAAVAKPARVQDASPRILNPSDSETKATSKEPQQTAKQDADNDEKQARASESSIYAAPPQDRSDRDVDREDDRDRDRDGEGIDGLASLLEKFTSDDGVEVGGEYGMKVEKGPDGEKNCRLDVPFVTVKFPCED